MKKTLVSMMLLAPLYATPALAGLELCNDTQDEQSVAIGHMMDGKWTSEGWWNIAAGDCATPLTGDLKNRYYYYRAEVPGGSFEDEGYVFCVIDDAFTIPGQDGCTERGFDQAGFRRIDTGETATHFTLNLVSPAVDGTKNKQTNGKPKGSDAQGNTATVQPLVSAPSTSWSSGHQKGSLGEPFSQMAVFQGCDAFDGTRYCAFHADGWKWYAYYGGATPDDFLDRVTTLSRGVGVEIEGDILQMGDISIEVALSRLTVRAASNDYQAEFEAIQGPWISDDDPSYRIMFAGGEILETYPNTPRELYFWRFADGCDDAPADVDFVLIKTVPDTQDQYCYLPNLITEDRLEIVYAPRGNTLSFSRP